jgi:dipeptidyl aminopeptidase/acylaminoacyl peptidase
VVKTTTAENKRLTDGDWSLPLVIPPSAPSSPFSWSLDGKTILFVKAPTAYPGDDVQRTIQMLNLADATHKPLTTRTKLKGYPQFSPDESKISYWYKNGNTMRSINELWITNTNGGEGKLISAQLNRDLFLSTWLPNNKTFLVGAHNENKTSMWSISSDGKTTAIDLGSVSPTWGFWLDATVSNAGGIAFTGSEPSKPVELYFMASTTSKLVQLTDYNSEVSEMTLGKTETIRWENDNLKHCGNVTYPTN